MHCNATTLGARADVRTRSLSRKILEMSACFQRVCGSVETGPKSMLAGNVLTVRGGAVDFFFFFFSFKSDENYFLNIRKSTR